MIPHSFPADGNRADLAVQAEKCLAAVSYTHLIVDPATSEKTQGYIDKLVELRQKKGMTPDQAKEILLNQYLYLVLFSGSEDMVLMYQL